MLRRCIWAIVPLLFPCILMGASDPENGVDTTEKHLKNWVDTVLGSNTSVIMRTAHPGESEVAIFDVRDKGNQYIIKALFSQREPDTVTRNSQIKANLPPLPHTQDAFSFITLIECCELRPELSSASRKAYFELYPHAPGHNLYEIINSESPLTEIFGKLGWTLGKLAASGEDLMISNHPELWGSLTHGDCCALNIFYDEVKGFSLIDLSTMLDSLQNNYKYRITYDALYFFKTTLFYLQSIHQPNFNDRFVPALKDFVLYFMNSLNHHFSAKHMPVHKLRDYVLKSFTDACTHFIDLANGRKDITCDPLFEPTLASLKEDTQKTADVILRVYELSNSLNELIITNKNPWPQISTCVLL